MNINDELEKIIVFLIKEEFILAHDFFENLWRNYKNNVNTREESFILKAFANATVSFELYKMQRIEHSKNVWNTYKKYENLIDEIKTINSPNYKKIKQIIYEKRELLIK